MHRAQATSALIKFIYHVTLICWGNSFVRCLLVDFSKAFDVIVGHSVFFPKSADLTFRPTFATGLLASLLADLGSAE